MAVAFAAAELLSRKALGLDLVFLIEGEEESGSRGFADAVWKNKVGYRSCLVFLDAHYCQRIVLAKLMPSSSGIRAHCSICKTSNLMIK